MKSSGIGHWKWQRYSAIALIPLFIWFVISIASLEFSFVGFKYWLSSSLNAILLVALAIISLYHGLLGIGSILDDYVSNLKTRKILLHLIALKVVVLLLFMFAGLIKLLF